MALINFSKFQVSKRFFRNPQIINIVIAIFSLFVIFTGLRFFGLYEGMQQDVTVDDTNTATSKTQANGQKGPMPQMSAMSQMGPMGQMGQMGPMGPMPPMYQMGPMGPMPQMGPMGPMYQIPSGVPQGVSQPNIPVT